jgi:hypothetical protein
MPGWRLAAPAVLASLALSGCYGSTEPATDIGEDRATLRGQGTANDGPAFSYFEYWAEGDPLPGHARQRTPTRSWPAGAQGPIAERVSDLLVASRYSFRLCGADQGETPVCAQTRTFSTPALAGDYVTGSFAGSEPLTQSPYTVRFNARSAPDGSNARGTVRFTFAGQTRTDRVTCLRIGATFADVGVVRSDGRTLIYAVRNAPEEPLSWGTSPTSNPPTCDPSNITGAPHSQRSFVIHDEP